MHVGLPSDPIQGLDKVKVTSAWKPLKKSRLSVPHRTDFFQDNLGKPAPER